MRMKLISNLYSSIVIVLINMELNIETIDPSES